MSTRPGTVMQGSSRFYIHPDSGDRAPGVTSILQEYAKPFLAPWQSRVTAQAAVDNLAAITDIVSRDPAGAVEFLKGAARRSTAGSAEVGTEIHSYIESRLRGTDPESLSEAAKPWVAGVEQFLDDWLPQPVLLEATVWGHTPTGSYAGSFDGVLTLAGERVLVDFKTGKSTHAEVGLQLSAYRFSDTILETGEAMPEVVGAAVLHLTPRGYTLAPVRASVGEFEVFSALHKVFAWRQTERTVIGKALKP